MISIIDFHYANKYQIIWEKLFSSFFSSEDFSVFIAINRNAIKLIVMSFDISIEFQLISELFTILS